MSEHKGVYADKEIKFGMTMLAKGRNGGMKSNGVFIFACVRPEAKENGFIELRVITSQGNVSPSCVLPLSPEAAPLRELAKTLNEIADGLEVKECQRCGSDVVRGYCRDLTCPFSDHLQSCKAGWSGHPDMDPHPHDDDAPMPCSCKAK